MVNPTIELLHDYTTGAKVSKPKEPLTTPGTQKLHRFWDTQPVPRVTDDIDGIKVLLNFSNYFHQSGPLINEPPEVPEQPYKLPPNFAWDDIDVANEIQIKELVDLLDRHYVEDDDACFRFQYSADCLRWALTPPGYHANWHIGIRANAKLVAFISGVPATIMVLDKAVKMAEINFLCIHTKLRNRRLAPVLIREVTRRVNLEKIWQAVYTAGVILPKPITTATYYHRSLNIKKLVDVGFTYLPTTQTMEIAERLSALPQSFTLHQVRVMQPEDISGVLQLLQKDFHCRRAQLYPNMTIEDVEHWLLPRKNIMNSYVKTDDEGEPSQHTQIDEFNLIASQETSLTSSASTSFLLQSSDTILTMTLSRYS